MKIKSAVATALLGMTAGTALTLKAQKALKKDENKRKLYDLADVAINGFTTGLAGILPNKKYPDITTYDSKNFYKGDEKFLTSAPSGAGWKLGFAKQSVMPEDIMTGEYYVAGYLAFPPHKVDGVLDDLFVRAISIDDGTGRGAVIFAVIDCVGISNHDIREIRDRLSDFAKENNIKAINISATHCHSGVDTLGIWGDLLGSIKNNVIESVKKGDNFKSGRNKAFMEILFDKAAETIKESFANMKAGRLSIGTIDATDYVHDKRPPEVLCTDINVLRFTPSDGSRQTKALFMAAHPVCVGYSNCSVSADFPLFICEQLEEYGHNAAFFQGFELAIATERGPYIPEGATHYEGIVAYGKAVADLVENADEKLFTEIEPYINIRLSEIFLTPHNKLFLALGKASLVSHNIVQIGNNKKDLRFATEIGYVELGSKYRIALVPGELAPELLLGGCYSKEESYNNEEWTLPAMQDMVDGYMFGIGLCNDEIGYVVPDNDYGGVVAPLHYEELVSTGKHAASKIVSEFQALINTVNTLK